MPITALPTPPSRSDPTNFAVRADAFLGALPVFATEANSTASAANASAVSATASAATASAAASTAVSTAGVSAWVSGTTYAIGTNTYSLITFLTYRRKTAGAGTTDPSADSTNWQLLTGQSDATLAGTQTFTGDKTFTGTSTFGAAAFAVTPTGAGLISRFASPGPIGNITPNTGNFTTVTAPTGNFTIVTATIGNFTNLTAADGSGINALDANKLTTGNVARGLLSGSFPTEFGNPGYIRLPNNLILQWGYFDHSTGNPLYGTVTFPVTFGTLLNVQASGTSSLNIIGVGYIFNRSTSLPSGSGFSYAIDNRDATNCVSGRVFWFAIGY